MKRQGNLLSFAFFGLVVQAMLLLLLGQAIVFQQLAGFLMAATGFMVYRVCIQERKRSKASESYFRREARRWWLRSEPENTLAFAMIGGMLLVFCNFALWRKVDFLELWSAGFVSIALTKVLFEHCRQLLNWFYAYLLLKVKQRRMNKYVEVKTGYG